MTLVHLPAVHAGAAAFMVAAPSGLIAAVVTSVSFEIFGCILASRVRVCVQSGIGVLVPFLCKAGLADPLQTHTETHRFAKTWSCFAGCGVSAE